MVGRLLRSADFERVLAAAPRARSTHFALHHVLACPSLPGHAAWQAASAELSTGDAPGCAPAVDDSAPRTPEAPASAWLGTVVPKRHARRAVTRNLIKRQMRALMGEHSPTLPPGLWVLRLKAPFDPRQFVSASSEALRLSARAELITLIERARARA